MLALMEYKVTATKVAREFATLIQNILVDKSKYIIERNGKQVAAIVPIEVYEQWKKERAKFFKNLNSFSTNEKLTDDELDKLISEAKIS